MTTTPLPVTQADRDAETKIWQEGAKRNYQCGNDLFRDLRAFIGTAGLNPSSAKLIIEFPTKSERDTLVDALRYSSPPIGEFSRASSAQAGNYGGTWQGVEYEFTVRHRIASQPATDAREAARIAELEAVLREHHNWHCNFDLDDAEYGFNYATEYLDSGMCERTLAALRNLAEEPKT